MNYFNYFTEIEDTFIRRRGRHLLLSPMDWALIESWKEMGVPLHVAIRAVEQAFDSHEAKPRRRSVKTLMYCQEEVEAQYAEWLDSQTGASPDDAGDSKGGESPAPIKEGEAPEPFPRSTVLSHLTQARAALRESLAEHQKIDGAENLSEILERTIARLDSLEKDFSAAARPDSESLEDSLTGLDRMINEALIASVGAGEHETLRAETEKQLKPYRSRMEEATYRQTFDNMMLKRVREIHNVPRLSLFYL